MKILLCLVVMTTVQCQSLTSQTCSSRRMVNIGAANPNVVIGGLFPLRTKGYGNYGCGSVGDGKLFFFFFSFLVQSISEDMDGGFPVVMKGFFFTTFG